MFPKKGFVRFSSFGDSFAPKLVKSTHTFPTRSHHVPAISPQVHRIWSLTRPSVTTGNIKNVWWVHGKAKVGIWSWSLKCEVNISGCLSPHTLIWQGQGWYEYEFFKSSDTLGLNFDCTVLYFAKQSVYVLPKRRVYCSEVAFPSHGGLICVSASNTSPKTLKSNGSLLESMVPKRTFNTHEIFLFHKGSLLWKMFFKSYFIILFFCSDNKDDHFWFPKEHFSEQNRSLCEETLKNPFPL